ncbi:MAG: twin-arginine translocase subunit TatC [Tepidiformaceae bacterium]
MTAEPTSPLPEIEEQAAGRGSGAEMTLIEHLKELRNRVIWCALSVVVGVMVCAFFWETILGWLLAPGREAEPGLRLLSFSPTDRIGVLFKIAIYGGLILASPMIIYQVLAFIVPGLTARERKILFPGVIGIIGFMLAGMAFAYWIVLPASLEFLLNFADDEFTTALGAKQYIDFAVRIIFWVGVTFEVPMVLALAAKLGLVRARQLLHFWRYAILIVFIVAAVVTPTPDFLTLLLVGLPMVALYFLGVLFAWIVQPKRPAPSPV